MHKRPWLIIFLFLSLTVIYQSTILAQDSTWTVCDLPFDKGILYDVHFVGENLGWAVGRDENAGSSVILNTIDAGDSWQLQAHPAQDGLMGIHFLDANSGVAVGQALDGKAAVLKTTDGGVNWTSQNTPAGFIFLEKVRMIDAAAGFAVGHDLATGKTIILGTTDGSEWQKVAHPAENGILYSLHFADSQHGWTAGADDFGGGPPVLFSTENGGATWELNDHGLDRGAFSDVFFVHPDTGFVCGSVDTSAVLLRTENGGADWMSTDIPGYTEGGPQLGKSAIDQSDLSKAIVCVRPVKPGYPWSLYAIARSKDIVRILISADKGRTWRETGTALLAKTVKRAAMPRPGVVFVVGTRGSALPFSASSRIVTGHAARIIIKPSYANIKAGEFVQYLSQVLDLLGNEITGSDVTYTASGGNITPDGLYTATTSGTFTVTSSVSGSSVTGTATVHVEVPSLARIDVTPEEATLDVGAMQLFTAKGFDAQGNELPITPNWSASGGTITTGGLYTGTTPGTFTVTSSVSGSSVTGTATVHVEVPSLARIDVTPEEATLDVGAMQLFTAKGFDAQGNELPITPNWSASGGSVTAEGLYTATVIGEFSVLAHEPTHEIIGEAIVTVIQHAEVKQSDNEKPEHFFLDQNYPNPFNPETKIRFGVKNNCRVRLTVFDLVGTEAVLLADARYAAGIYEIRFDARDFPAGVYVFRIQMGDFQAIRKLTILK